MWLAIYVADVLNLNEINSKYDCKSEVLQSLSIYLSLSLSFFLSPALSLERIESLQFVFQGTRRPPHVVRLVCLGKYQHRNEPATKAYGPQAY